MYGLTTLGVVHTLISLVAVFAGFVCLFRDRAISSATGTGKVYIVTTALTCLTGFGIFRHGGFGAPHVLGIVTLVVLGIAGIAGRGVFGGASRYVSTIAYSLTFFFHAIPGVTESTTRLPLGAPVFSSPDDPMLKAIIGGCFVIFLIGAALQARALRTPRPLPMGVTAA